MTNQFDDFQCQVKLPGFGLASQKKLTESKVLIVGLGGLGCPAAQFLARVGVGRLGLVDFDSVSRSNLHRQILYQVSDCGKPKTESAARRLQEQVADIRIDTFNVVVSAENVMNLISEYDVVLDCTDNFAVRYCLSDACVLSGKPLVYGAAYQFQGQVAVWNAPNDDGTFSPHYREIFPENTTALSVDCNQGGVMPTLTGIIGTMQANEAVKFLTGLGDLLKSRLVVVDVRSMQMTTVKLPKSSSSVVTSLAESTPAISAVEVKKRPDDYVLIDVRSAAEHTNFNIGGDNIPYEQIIQLADQLPMRPVVLYCQTGGRSTAAVNALLRQNPKLELYSLAGGLSAWQ